ncbi:MAG: TolB family protein, partial [Candidatus Bipolaricaulia bacterium]
MGGCALPPPLLAGYWVDVSPDGLIAFVGAGPLSVEVPELGLDDDMGAVMLFHPGWGMGVKLLEAEGVRFSWPKWWVDPYDYYDDLYLIADGKTLDRIEMDFWGIEELPITLEGAEQVWTDGQEIAAPSPSPDGRYLAYLREDDGEDFEVVVLGLEWDLDEGQTPPYEVATPSTAWMPTVPWTPDGEAILLVRREERPAIMPGGDEIPLG